jgi:hypothetical protein
MAGIMVLTGTITRRYLRCETETIYRALSLPCTLVALGFIYSKYQRRSEAGCERRGGSEGDE